MIVTYDCKGGTQVHKDTAKKAVGENSDIVGAGHK